MLGVYLLGIEQVMFAIEEAHVMVIHYYPDQPKSPLNFYLTEHINTYDMCSYKKYVKINYFR